MRAIFHSPWRCAALALAAFAFASPAAADDPATVTAVQVRAADDGTQIIIEGDRPLTAARFALAGPDRFVFDVREARWRLNGAAAGQAAGAGAAQRYRFAPRPDGSARLVLDLNGPATLASERTEAGGRRLVFLLRSAAEPGVTPVSRTFPAPSARTQISPPPVQPPRRMRTIVIDPGHGGHDPGAVSAGGQHEEAVTLAAALALRDALTARGGYRVVLTRDSDEYLTLEERVRRARAPGADLFISLHADSSPDAGARGASVYTLSERGATRAQALMNAQDWEVDLGEDAPRSAAIRDILVDLTQRETTDRSGAFARTVIAQLDGAAPLLRNTHRNAGFFVLLAPDVPAVLIEMGFMTNPEDARRLNDPAQRARFAGALADAVDAHFAAPVLTASR